MQLKKQRKCISIQDIKGKNPNQDCWGFNKHDQSKLL